MRISSKTEYSIRALFDLAQNYGCGLAQSEDIATRQHIPVNYLNQILITLRKGGLIESQRGPQGGHMLARPPQHITLLHVVHLLEGPLVFHDEPDVPSDDCQLVRDTWQQLRTTLMHQLQQVTFEDLCERKRHYTGCTMYYI